VIWSIEHDAWWGPGRRGYTRELAAAGRYTRQEALEILERANLVKVNECLIPIECIADTPTVCPECHEVVCDPDCRRARR
jgi:hypothetical protein